MRFVGVATLTLSLLSPAAAQQLDAPHVRPSLSQQRMVNPGALRPSGPQYVEGMNPDAQRRPLPQGRGQNPVPRGTGGASDVARAGASLYRPEPPTGLETPSYGIPRDPSREQAYDLMPGQGPRQGYYESSQGYFETPDFSAPPPRYTE